MIQKNIEQALKKARENGFTKVSFDDLESCISQFSEICTIDKHITRLIPKESVEKSYSGTYGLGEFPLHSDFTYKVRPPNFIFLFCSRMVGMPVSTNLLLLETLEFHGIDIADLRHCIVMTSLRKTATLVEYSNDNRIFRYDLHALSPIGYKSELLFNQVTNVIREVKPTQVALTEGECLIINNWSCLHGRGAVKDPHCKRTLYRFVGNEYE